MSEEHDRHMAQWVEKVRRLGEEHPADVYAHERSGDASPGCAARRKGIPGAECDRSENDTHNLPLSSMVGARLREVWLFYEASFLAYLLRVTGIHVV